MKRGGGKSASLWVNGLWQTAKDAPGGNTLTSIGLGAGVRADVTPELNLTVAG